MKSGIEFVTKHGDVVYQETFGYRDVGQELKNNIDTSFPLASGGKFFIAIGILQLIEQNKLQLDTKLNEVLDISFQLIDPEVNIFQLLTHTSGIPDYCDEEKVPDYAMLWKSIPNYSIRKGSDLLPLFIDEPMKYPKGSKFEYNNSAFTLLGIILENLSGKSLDAYMEEHIYGPLGLKHTGYYELDRLPKNTAQGILKDKDGRDYSFIYSIDVKGSGAGGIFSCAKDLVRLFEGIFAYKILTKNSVDNMIKKHVQNQGLSYGLGVWIDELGHLLLLGEDPGVSFVLRYDIKKDIIVITISNRQMGQYQRNLDLYHTYK